MYDNFSRPSCTAYASKSQEMYARASKLRHTTEYWLIKSTKKVISKRFPKENEALMEVDCQEMEAKLLNAPIEKNYRNNPTSQHFFL